MLCTHAGTGKTNRCSTEHDSHPVGTTVKVTGFFQHIPVRKQAAPKNATKCLAGIRRLMQAYALARPGTRLRLRVLKAKNANSDFVYAPKADANVEDAVLKIMGRDCAHQCDWTVTESNGFEIHACLPKPTATGPKIANQGSFVSIDARPVASSRGTIKQMISAYKERLRKVNPSLAGIKDPFVCVNIICPPGSYDPNIEPAKDDVMFDDGKAVLGVFERLLQSYYPEIVVNHDVDSQSTLQNEPQPDNIPEQYQEDTSSQSQSLNEETENPASGISQGQPKWRSSMYGIDEDDLEFLQHHRTPVIEEEEEQGRLAIEVSNPWTIARMNAPVKPKQSISHVQLPSPAKSNRDITLRSSSPGRPATPNPSISADPLTPRTCPNSDAARRALDEVLERSIQRLPRASSVASASIDDSTEEQLNTTPSQVSNRIILQPEAPSSILQPESQPPDPWTLPSEQHASTAARAERRRQPTRGPKPYLAPRAQNNTTPPTLPYIPPSGPSQPQSRAPEARAHPTAVQHVNRENNSDTRAFLSRQNRAVSSRNIALDSSFTRINPPDQARVSAPSMGTQIARRGKSGQDIDAYFRAHENNAVGPPLPPPAAAAASTSTTTIHKHPAPNTSKHKPPPQHLRPILTLHITLDCITRNMFTHARTTDYGRRLSWDAPLQTAYSTFVGEHVAERAVAVWAGRLERLLGGLYEGVEGVCVRGVVEREIWGAVGRVSGGGGGGEGEGEGCDEEVEIGRGRGEDMARTQDEIGTSPAESDRRLSFSFGGEAEDRLGRESEVAGQEAEGTGGDEDVEDEMLMDM